jgi:iron(III) transport system permease protein
LIRRILLPLSAPASLTGVGLVFLLALLEYGVPSLLGLDTYALEIFSEFSFSASPGRALLVSLPLLSLALAVLLLLLRPLRQLALNTRLNENPWRLPPGWPVGWGVLLSAALLTAGLLVLIPLIGLVWQVGGLKTWSQVVWLGRSDAFFSLRTCVLATLLTLPLAWSAAWVLLESKSPGWISWLIVLGPAALPASLIGIGLVSLPADVPELLFLRNGSLLTALGTVARFLPVAALVMLAALRTVDPALLEAARIYQGSAWRRLVWVSLPLLSPGLMAAGGVVFALGLGELGSALLTAPPGSATLTLRIYNYLHYGASQEVAGLCLLLALGIFLVSGGMLLAANRVWGWLNLRQGSL